MADGKKIQHGRLTRDQLDVGPLSTKDITVPFSLPASPAPGTEYFLELSFTTQDATPWAESGFEVARQQLAVDAGSPAVTPVPLAGVPVLKYEESDEAVTVTGKGYPGRFSVTVDKASGTITSYKAGGTRLITSGPVPNFWRAPTDNDHGNGQHTRNQTWRDAGTNRKVTGVTVRALGDRAVEIKVSGTLPTTTESTYTTTYTVFGNGEIKVDNTLHPGAASLPYIPEVGNLLLLTAASTACTTTAAAPRRTTGTATTAPTWASTPATSPTSGPATSAPRRTATRPTSAGPPSPTATAWACWSPATADRGQRLVLHPGGPVDGPPPRLPPHPARRRSSCASTTARWESAATTAGAPTPTTSTSSSPTATTPTRTGCAR